MINDDNLKLVLLANLHHLYHLFKCIQRFGSDIENVHTNYLGQPETPDNNGKKMNKLSFFSKNSSNPICMLIGFMIQYQQHLESE